MYIYIAGFKGLETVIAGNKILFSFRYNQQYIPTVDLIPRLINRMQKLTVNENKIESF